MINKLVYTKDNKIKSYIFKKGKNMKKLLTLGNVVKVCAVLFALVAFFLMFSDQLYVELLGNRGYVKFDDAFFSDNGAPISFVGYLLVLIAGLAVCALVFLPLEAKLKKFISFGLAVLLVLGAVFIFIEAAVVNGDGNAYHLTAGPIIAGILAILAGIAVCLAEFLPEKQLVK